MIFKINSLKQLYNLKYFDILMVLLILIIILIELKLFC